ncbi:MAG: GNAT family N-acetyltransferase [Alphaproteobacteria bacterium]
MDELIKEEIAGFPNQAIIQAIIDKGKIGKVVNLSSDSIVIIENCSDPFTFVAGSLNDIALKKLAQILKEYESPMIYCNPIYHPYLLKSGYDYHLRAELGLDRFKPIEYGNAKIHRIDSIEKAKFYNLKEHFSKYSFGYIIADNNQITSEAYVTIGRDWGELSIYTHADFRQRNYAKKILSCLIQECINKKIIPIWSCQVDNKASLYTALSLGFNIKNYYTFLVPEWGNVLCPNLATWIRTNNYP